MIRKTTFYFAKGLVLGLHNAFGRNKTRTDRFIQDEYTVQTNDWKNYEEGPASRGIQGNQFRYLTNREKCDAYIDRIGQEIKENNSVLEAGCGGGVNVIVLKQRYPEKEFLGFDFVQARVESATRVALQKKQSVRFFQGDIRTIPLADKAVDMAFTNLALEQLPNHTIEAITELVRVVRHRIVLVEPCYEFGNFAQKQYLIYKDYTRSLKRDIEMLESRGKLKIQKAEKLDCSHNPLNPVSIFVLAV